MRTAVLLVIASLAGAASARLAGQEPKLPAVKASRFELVDAEGRTRAVLGMSKGGSPEFDLRDADGRPRALLVLDGENLPIFFFKDAGVVTRAKIELRRERRGKIDVATRIWPRVSRLTAPNRS
jgi:hypothetical protein